MPNHRTRHQFGIAQWAPLGRAVVFALSATSILCLLAEFYGVGSMRGWVFLALTPATMALVVLALVGRAAGEGRYWRSVLIGAVSGLVAAIAYDVFRLPFVVAAADRIGPVWLRLPLFKVFPRFGAMILAQPFTATQSDWQFSLSAHLVGWAYHFSNGVSFGVMYMAIIGNAQRRSWWWAVLMAVGLEVAMLLTPYTGFFMIPLTARFVVVTLAAHMVFGVVLGKCCRWWGVAEGGG